MQILYIMDGARPLYILGGAQEAAIWAARSRAMRRQQPSRRKPGGTDDPGGNYGIIVKQLKQ